MKALGLRVFEQSAGGTWGATAPRDRRRVELGGDDATLTFSIHEGGHELGRVALLDAWGLDGEEVALAALSALGLYRPESFLARGDRHDLGFSGEGLAVVVHEAQTARRPSRRFVVMEI